AFHVTGVQTCALPISLRGAARRLVPRRIAVVGYDAVRHVAAPARPRQLAQEADIHVVRVAKILRGQLRRDLLPDRVILARVLAHDCRLVSSYATVAWLKPSARRMPPAYSVNAASSANAMAVSNTAAISPRPTFLPPAQV